MTENMFTAPFFMALNAVIFREFFYLYLYSEAGASMSPYLKLSKT